MENLCLNFEPIWENNTVKYMNVKAFGKIQINSLNEPILVYCKEAFTIPFAEYDSFEIKDDLGEVEFEIKKIPSIRDYVEFLGVFAKREIKGNLNWKYRVYPRILPKNYRSSPYFDFRAEYGGLNSAGITFLIMPNLEKIYNISIKWDLDNMPKDSRGVWSLGVGDITKEIKVYDFITSYFAVGMMNSIEEGEFGIYWFGETPFDIKTAAERVKDLFLYMSKYFNDDSGLYRVFLRRDPFEISGGGSAFNRTFMSGYSEKSIPDIQNWFNVLAHEMVHNWPHMDDKIAGIGTWYTEGIAEYYSVMLPLRAGITSAKEEAIHITSKAKRYLDCPLRDMTNMELAKIYWSDRRAQPVPYGRGFIYLSNVDTQLRRLGKGSIDDISKLYYMDNPMTPDKWEEFIKERLGEQGLKDFEDMKSGKLVVPDPEGFDGYFNVIEKDIELNGVIVKTYEWEAK